VFPVEGIFKKLIEPWVRLWTWFFTFQDFQFVVLEKNQK